ncbi:MAG: tetratricopeptide repeat protein [Myxococcales bacterium]|nr:tetratricopeptide repeat protein [Myxococcales bacterium]
MVLTVATVAVYWSGLGHDFVWDDHSLVIENAKIRSPASFGAIWTDAFWDTSSGEPPSNPVYAHLYRPVVTMAYVLEFRAFGEHPFGYHVVGLLLHVACVLLAWRWLAHRLGRPPGMPAAGAILGAILFAMHPSRPESVTWISGSTELWMMLWLGLGLWAWDAAPRRWASPLAAVAFVLAMLSKETAVVVPCLLALDRWLLPGAAAEAGPRTRSWRDVGMVAGLFVVGFVVRVLIVPLGGAGKIDVSPVGALRVFATLGYYVWHSVWPWTPSVHIGIRQGLPDGTPTFETAAVLTGVATAVIAIGLVALAVKKLGVRPWVADLLWFLLPLAPVLNLFDVGGYGLAAERFLYLPILGLAALLGRAANQAIRTGPPWRGVVFATEVSFAAACVVIAWAHVNHFRDDGSLWAYELEVEPENIYAVEQLAIVAHGAAEPERAADLFKMGYDMAVRAQNDWAAVQFSLRLASEIITMTADADQATLRMFRDMYLRVETEGVIRYAIRDANIHLKLPPPVRDAVMRNAQYYRVPRASTLIRTMREDLAAVEYEEILKLTRLPAVWTQIVWNEARRGNWQKAEEAMRNAEARLPGNGGVRTARRSLDAARKLHDEPVADERARVFRDTRVFKILGAMERARVLIRPYVEAHPGDFEAAYLLAEVEAADRQFDRASAVLEAGRAASPPEDPRWAQALAALEDARGRVHFITHVWSTSTAGADTSSATTAGATTATDVAPTSP